MKPTKYEVISFPADEKRREMKTIKVCGEALALLIGEAMSRNLEEYRQGKTAIRLVSPRDAKTGKLKSRIKLYLEEVLFEVHTYATNERKKECLSKKVLCEYLEWCSRERRRRSRGDKEEKPSSIFSAVRKYFGFGK